MASRRHRQVERSWRANLGPVDGRNEPASCQIPLCRPSLPGRGDQPGGVAVLSLPARPAHGRGNAGGTRHCGQPRDHPAVGAQVRPGVRQPDPAKAPPRRGQVAPRRGRHQDCRGETLALACRRSDRDGNRCAGAEAPSSCWPRADPVGWPRATRERSSGRGGNPANVGPRVERTRPYGSIFTGAAVVAAEMEEVGDLVVGGEETLCLPR